MGIKQTLKKIFSTSTESSENHYEEQLQTHYYKVMKDKALQEVEAMLKNRQGYKVVSISEAHGEIIVNVKKGKKAFLVATVIMIRPLRTAVDFSVSTDTIFFSDFGHSKKIVEGLYKELDSRLQFVGTGLGNELS
ncbi:DUF1499 domain-containing protein [Salipaludibacillus sp. HK11]|uniref:DUF1499 domain-containing protein n=1 Tax=Salipaludibacillus sp. HK11 TaxID=3394320 RepID=UPI0039FDD574